MPSNRVQPDQVQPDQVQTTLDSSPAQVDTEESRARLLAAAKASSTTPDPFASITMADIAARIDKPESSILYLVEPEGDADALVIFRRRAYVRVVERFEVQVGRVAHGELVTSLTAGDSVPQILGRFCSKIAEQFLQDPSTPYLLGSVARTSSNPSLNEVTQQTWSDFTSNIVDMIELIVATNGQRVEMDRDHLQELVRIATAAGWMQTELVSHLDHKVVEVDGASFEQTGLVIWTGIKKSLRDSSA